MMKILITAPIFPPEIGGPAIYSLEVSRRLRERGHRVRVVAFTDSKPAVEDLEIIPVRIHYKILGTVLRQVRLFFTVLRAAKDMELIYAQGPVVVGLASLIAGKITGRPVVVKFVGDIAWETAFNSGRTSRFLEDFLCRPEGGLYIRLIMRIQKLVFHSADRIITPSEYLKGVLVKYYKVPPDRIAVVYNAVELAEVGPLMDKPGQPVAITVGRLVPWKGVDELIELVPSLTMRFPGFRLVVVGDGPEEKRLRKLCQETGVEERVYFAGRISHEQTLACLRSSDVFVLNSRYEGLPHTVIEAMACRCPVVATNIGGTTEVVEDGITGLTVAPGNRRQLEEKIVFLLQNEDARREMVARAYDNVKGKFTWKSTLGKLEEALAGTLG